MLRICRNLKLLDLFLRNRRENKKQDEKYGVANTGAELNLQQLEGGY